MSSSSNLPPLSKRLESLDALRGFTMFWIIGGGTLVAVIAKRNGWDGLAQQMRHVEWEGFHFFDLIFPLFMFVAGVSIPLAMRAQLGKGASKAQLQLKAVKRMVVLFVLGLLFTGAFKNGFENARIASVLGQIGIAYCLAATIVLHTDGFRSRFAWLAGILAGIGVLQMLVPVPDIGAGVLTPEGSINNYIDHLLAPEGWLPARIVNSIAATSLTLAGALAGGLLGNPGRSEKRKLLLLTASGVVCILLALALEPVYPIIKLCMTSTFNLLTCGIGLLLLALFYFIIDVLRFRKWAFVFKVIGMNSIFAYLFGRIVGTQRATETFLGSVAMLLEDNGRILLICGNFVFLWLLLYYMYKKKIFLRV